MTSSPDLNRTRPIRMRNSSSAVFAQRWCRWTRLTRWAAYNNRRRQWEGGKIGWETVREKQNNHLLSRFDKRSFWVEQNPIWIWDVDKISQCSIEPVLKKLFLQFFSFTEVLDMIINFEISKKQTITTAPYVGCFITRPPWLAGALI